MFRQQRVLRLQPFWHEHDVVWYVGASILEENLPCPILIPVTLLPAYLSLIPNDSLLPSRWTHTGSFDC